MQIYLIRHRESGKGYVGQTIWDFNTRYKAGNWVGTTHSQHLRAAGRKYGAAAFDVSILWEGQCTRDELDALEERFMREHNTLHPTGYNLKEAGRTGRHHCMCREYELIDKAGTIYHVVNLRQFCKRQGLNYNAMLNMVSGRTDSSHGLALSTTPIERITDPTETWELEHVATGKRQTVMRRDIPVTAAALGIRRHMLTNMLRGACAVSNGWKLVTTQLSPERITIEQRRYHGIELVHQNGERVTVTDIPAFARERGMDRGPLFDVINGKGIQTQGWRLASTTDPHAEHIRRCGMEVDLVHIPTGERVHVKNVSEWCRQRGLNRSSMQHALSRHGRTSQGWTLAG